MNQKINLDDTVFALTEQYPQIVSYLVQKGFAPLSNPVMRKLMGSKISLKKALLSKNLDVESCEAELNALIETESLTERADSSLKKLKNDPFSHLTDGKQCIKIQGILPCPVRIPLLEAFEELYASYTETHADEMKKAGYTFSYDLRSANLGIDWLADAFKDEQTVPDLMLSTGFDFFFDKARMAPYTKKDMFYCPVLHMNADFCSDSIDLRDKDNVYAVIGVVPALMVVNKAALNGRPMPKRWADLFTDEFENALALPFKDLDLFNALLLNVYKLFGDEGIQKLAKACGSFLHPAQMVKENYTYKEGDPAVHIAPYFFSTMIRDDSQLEVVWPEDGAVLAPIFMLAKKETCEKTRVFSDFFLSKEVGTLLSQNGFFPSTNPDVDNKLDKDKKFLWIGWDFLKQNDIGELLEKLNADFEKALGAKSERFAV
ncbi:ABC transporter substrate-binding protein [Treponema sp. HNW]|uniref:ABC transporter substrate-binding protein n=1 Tax=Treponema sp. HNW TaxID=3116654 RepID=UPI003D0994FD